MVSTRKKHYCKPPIPPPPPHFLRTLIGFPPPQRPDLQYSSYAGDSPFAEYQKSLKAPVLNSLYRLLLDLCSRRDAQFVSVASNSFDVKFRKFSFNIEFKEICDLSDILFRELHERFTQLFPALHEVSATQDHGQPGLLYSQFFETAEEELTLVLRCCMVILNLLVSDQNLLLEKCNVLLSILGRICSLDLTGEKTGPKSWSFNKSVSRNSTSIDNGCTSSIADSCLPYLSTMLEVFADELLAHRPLRENFFLINSFSSTTTSERLFICHPSHSVMGSVIEVIAAHFLTFFSSEQAFENLLNQSFWQHGKNYTIPQLSLPAGLSLLLNPIMLSAPIFLQAHVISLVAEAIGINMASKSLRPDHRLMDLYLSAFEKSVILYARNMSGLQMNGYPVGAENSAMGSSLHGSSFQQSFESYIQPVTTNKINHLVTKFESSWHSCLCNMYSRTNAELVAAATAYIKESQDVLVELGKADVLAMLQVILVIASGDGSNTSLQTKGKRSPQDLCLMASILKLMSSSLLQVLWCLRRSRNVDCLKSKDLSSCREYVRVLGIISSCFQQFSVHLPIQRILCDVMESHPMWHKESKLMLFHLSGLLSLSFVIGHEFLLKGCIYTIMLSMNLFIFEEGNMDALRSFLGSELKSYSSQLSPEKVQEVHQVKQKSSRIIASKFQKFQTMYLSSDFLANECTINQDVRTKTLANDLSQCQTNLKPSVVETVEETEETCSGKIFLKCILKGGELSKSDDLTDFIECKQGKDYSSWLKNRQRYRRLKSEKLAVLKWRKRKKIWKYKIARRT